MVAHSAFIKLPLYVLILGVFVVFGLLLPTPTQAATGINQHINFQGRLLNAQGATVPDGYYNIQFKIYQDGDGQSVGNTTGSPAGTLLWTESHLNQASQGVQVKNGFMSVQLGSVTAFGTSVDWNQDTLWLSMNIGSTNGSCTPFTSCTPDGEMIPMKRLSSTPYAMNAGALGGLSASNFVQLAPGTQQTDATNNSTININKTGTGNLLTLQDSGANAFVLNNTGDVVFGSAGDHSITVEQSNASVVGRTLSLIAGNAGPGAAVNGGDLVLQGGTGSGTGTSGNVIVKSNTTNTAGAFQVQNSSGTAAMTIDTTNNSVKIAGILDTTTATTLELGTTNATGINLNKNTAVTGTSTLTVGTGLTTLGGGLAVTAGAVDITSSAALKKGSDFSTTGSSDNVNFGEVSYIRLIGASTQTITGIANGRDGEILTITNAASQAAILSNNSGSSSANNRIITGSGTDLSLAAGASITMVYDSTAALWRATGSAAGNASGVSTVGAIDTQTKSANGAVINGTSIYLQTADATSVGLVSTGAQTLAGAKTFSSLLTGNAGTTVSGGAISLTGNAASSLTTSSGALTITSAAAATWSSTAGNITLQAGSGTVSLGSSTALTSTGALTVTGGSTLALATTGANALSADTGGAAAVNIGTVNATSISVGRSGQTTTVNGALTVTQAATFNNNITQSGSGTLSTGTGNVSLNGATSVTGSNTFSVGTGLSSLGGGLAVTSGSSDFTNSVAFKKGTDYSTTGSTDDAAFGNASLIRLTGASAQTITGIASGRDGYVLALVNAASQAAVISNNNSGSLAANRIITGTGGDISLPAGASISLVYDTTASLWRVTSGTVAATGGYIQNQIAAQQASSNFWISATGRADTSLLTPTVDVASAATLNIGNTTATAINLGRSGITTTNAGALTVTQLLTGNAGATVGGGAIALTGNAASSFTTSSGALTITSAAAATWSTNAGNLTLQAGSGTVSLGSSTGLTSTGALTVTGGTTLALASTGTNNASLDTGGSATVNIGTVNASTIQIGNTNLASGTQTIGIGNNNTVGGTTNITIGAGGSATGGTTTLQAKGNITINTNGITRATFDTANGLYFGNGVTAAAPSNFTLSGTGSTTTAVAGGSMTIQGGNATVGSANGGNITLTGGSGIGSGARGLVVIDTPTMTTASSQTCLTNCNITQANIDGSGAVLINASNPSLTVTLSDPTITTAGRLMYVTNFGSNDFTLAVNGGVGATNVITLKPNTTATMIWNGSDWTAAGASSSTDLQAAYNNTASSAGAAELVLKNTSTSNGLTIRNGTSTDEIIGGGLIEVQTSIGSNLFSVNNNATEYANNGGAETSTFTMWTGAPAGGTITRYTTTGNNIATGIASVFVDTTSTAATGVRNTLSSTLTANLKYRVSYAIRHTSATSSFTTLDTIFSRDGTDTSTTSCSTAQTATYGQWTRVSCTFTAPSSGITASNAIFIRHSDAVEHDFYIDNLSVNVSADVNHAADGSVDSALGSNWVTYDADGGAGASPLTRDTSVIYDTSGAVRADTTAHISEGMRNNMTILPQISTQYLVSFYARSSTTFNDITVGFLPAGGNGLPNSSQLCTDYNTQSVSTTGWTKITCLVTTPSSGISDPDLVIYQPTASARAFYVDALSITLNTNNSSNVQIGGGNKGGPATLFTLDRSNGAPIANNNDNYLGSMYYDTSTGRIQCYEADGWGACGAAPDNIVNLNPEYAGAVLNGTGVGTMTADFCSNDTPLQVNTSLCSSGQAKNFYRWTSPQPSQQTYSIYVTYQLPATFNGFSSDDTVQLVARVDSTSNASVTYEMFKSTGSDVDQCGSGETNVITGGGGAADTWYSFGVNGNEATGCSFNSSSAGNLVIFKINLKAEDNANAYVSTLSFTTTGR